MLTLRLFHRAYEMPWLVGIDLVIVEKGLNNVQAEEQFDLMFDHISNDNFYSLACTIPGASDGKEKQNILCARIAIT